MTQDQLSGALDRGLLVIATWVVTWLVQRGILSAGQAADLAPHVGAVLVAAVGMFVGWWKNRPKAIVQSAAALPNTVVVTDTALANSTPEKNIISESGDVRAAMASSPKG